jgi:hypothetical protein
MIVFEPPLFIGICVVLGMIGAGFLFAVFALIYTAYDSIRNGGKC